MKKILLFAATATMLFAACTNEDLVAPQTGAETALEDGAVGFDVYVPGATAATRAGFDGGSINTVRLQYANAGFGVYAFHSDQDTYANYAAQIAASKVPNFMFNEQVTWKGSGWGYSPLKFWPNETTHDSQADPALTDGTTQREDELTFFAYAPWVEKGVPGEPGITSITNNNGWLNAWDLLEPSVEYKAAFADANKGVDLLWGVAPSGGLNYTAVNGSTVSIGEGLPLVDMVKPDVNTSMKFLFEHALARFGFTVSAAIDQVPQGGGSTDIPNDTKITINSVKVTGRFGETGILNLHNTAAHVANWIRVNGKGKASVANLDDYGTTTLTIPVDQLAKELRYEGAKVQTNEGVTTKKKELLKSRYGQVEKPASFSTAKAYYTSAGVEKHATMENTGYYLRNVAGDFVKVGGATINSPAYGTPMPTYYTITPGDAVTSWTSGDLYRKEGDNYAKVADPSGVGDFSGNDYFQFTATPAAITDASFTYPDGDYYLPERSFYMVVPTNNVLNAYNITPTGVYANLEDVKKELRTVTVEIEYYVTTKDDKLAAQYNQVKNVVTKKVVLPSLENGKSYNLNLVLGMTSVKIEAEVDDWKVVNAQVDLPQNTAGE